LDTKLFSGICVQAVISAIQKNRRESFFIFFCLFLAKIYIIKETAGERNCFAAKNA